MGDDCDSVNSDCDSVNSDCDSVNSDCDGVSDEALWPTCAPLAPRPRPFAKQEELLHRAAGWPEAHQPQPDSQLHTADNDCDGLIDEDCNGPAPSVGATLEVHQMLDQDQNNRARMEALFSHLAGHVAQASTPGGALADRLVRELVAQAQEGEARRRELRLLQQRLDAVRLDAEEGQAELKAKLDEALSRLNKAQAERDTQRFELGAARDQVMAARAVLCEGLHVDATSPESTLKALVSRVVEERSKAFDDLGEARQQIRNLQVQLAEQPEGAAR